MSTPGAITLIRARGRRLAKLVQSDGTLRDYDAARTFDLFELPVPDLDALVLLLNRLLHRPDVAVLRGSIVDRDRTRNVRRLAYPDRTTGDQPTLRDVPRQWLALDMEGVQRPHAVLASDLSSCTAEAIRQLPAAFQGARCISQATAGHGIKPGCRLRIWYWLTRGVSGAELKHWLRGTSADPSVFHGVQPIYTAAPIFAPGIRDHLPRRMVERSGVPAVVVPPPDELKPTRRHAAPARPMLVADSARADLYVRMALTKAAARIIGADRRHPAILSEACGLARLVHGGLLRKCDMQSVLWQAAQQAGKDDQSEIDRIVEFSLNHANAAPLPADRFRG